MRDCLVSSGRFSETGMYPHHLLKLLVFFFCFFFASHFIECLLYLDTTPAPLLCVRS